MSMILIVIWGKKVSTILIIRIRKIITVILTTKIITVTRIIKVIVLHDISSYGAVSDEKWAAYREKRCVVTGKKRLYAGWRPNQF
jgi:hypothetical protein